MPWKRAPLSFLSLDLFAGPCALFLLGRMSYRFGTHAVYTQSWQGLKSDTAVYESLAASQRRKAFAAGGQETWCCGFESFEQNGYTFLGIGPDKPLSKRGSQGINITLSHRATEAWKRAGQQAVRSTWISALVLWRCASRFAAASEAGDTIERYLPDQLRSARMLLPPVTGVDNDEDQALPAPELLPVRGRELARLSSVLSQPTSSNYGAITYNFST